ncbi:MAG: MAPEG family protein [Rhizobiaceae bacterium]
MSNTAIFWPVILQAALTILIYLLMAKVRFGLVVSGSAKPSEFRTYENEPVESRKWSRAVANQFESPVLFYAICIMAFVTANVDTVMLSLAWAYSLVKTAHVYLHVTANRIKFRQPVFTLALLILLIQLIWLAIKLMG